MEKIRLLLNSETPVRWLFTGDSITQGARYTFGHRDYVQLFEERIRYELERYRDFVIRTAITGWNTKLIKDDIEWNILQFNPHVISIMLGMNDANEGLEYIDEFKNNYQVILDTISSRTKAYVFLHTPNPIIPGTRPVRETSLPAIGESIRQLGSERKIPVVDHLAEWQLAWQENPNRIAWMGNGLHPNNYGHRVFARLLFKELGIWDEASPCCRLFIPEI